MQFMSPRPNCGMSNIPLVATGMVTSQDGDRYRVYVMLDGAALGQMPALGVCVGTHGPRDGVRVKAAPLPTKGTRGVILFPRGDIRNGVWVCSVEGPENDALPGKPGLTAYN